MAGLVACWRVDLALGKPIAGFPDAALDDRLVALISGWRHAGAGNWAGVAALDVAIGGIAPGDALFEEATRLRIRWRLVAEDPAASAEAKALAETLLSRRWDPNDALLRARASIAAGQPTAAWGSLSRIADMMPGHPQAGPLLAAAREIVARLPDEIGRDLRTRLESVAPLRVQGGPLRP